MNCEADHESWTMLNTVAGKYAMGLKEFVRVVAEVCGTNVIGFTYVPKELGAFLEALLAVDASGGGEEFLIPRAE